MPVIFVSLQTGKEPMPCLRSGSLGFLWHIHGWLPVNVDAVRDQAGDDRLKVDPHPHPKLPDSVCQRGTGLSCEISFTIFGN